MHWANTHLHAWLEQTAWRSVRVPEPEPGPERSMTFSRRVLVQEKYDFSQSRFYSPCSPWTRLKTFLEEEDRIAVTVAKPGLKMKKKACLPAMWKEKQIVKTQVVEGLVGGKKTYNLAPDSSSHFHEDLVWKDPQSPDAYTVDIHFWITWKKTSRESFL